VAGEVLRIGSDIDDVLLHSAKLTVQMHNEHFGTGLTIHDWYAPFEADKWQVPTQVESFGRVNAILSSDEFIARSEPMEGALRTLWGLVRAGHVLSAVTGRPQTEEPPMRVKTLEALSLHYPGLFTSRALSFTDHLAQNAALRRPRQKTEVARKRGLTHFIDDHPKHANMLGEAGIRTVLFGNYPWNQVETHPNVTHLPDWDAVEEYFDDEEKLLAA
jgi:uncharacterized HAD superfamily protein